MYKHLTQNERYYIWHRSANLFESISQIAKDLHHSKSTISRELSRNKDKGCAYDPYIAEVKSIKRRHDSKSSVKFSSLKGKALDSILSGLNNNWSPEQISGRLKKISKLTISFKTIYNYIWFDKLSGGNLYKNLAHRGKKYKYGNPTKIRILNRIDISKRPAIVASKSRIGDYEGDTIVGTKGGSKNCLLTLVDRKSKFTLIRRILDKSASSVVHAMYNIYDNTILPFKTITYDNGLEFSSHDVIAKNIGCEVYFARPYKSCDRGLNEHTNGLIRYFFPKKTDFCDITDDEIRRVESLLNNRPRKVLGYLTPNEVMNKYLKRLFPNWHKIGALQCTMGGRY